MDLMRRVQLYVPIGAIDIFMSVSTGNVYTCTYTYITLYNRDSQLCVSWYALVYNV